MAKQRFDPADDLAALLTPAQWPEFEEARRLLGRRRRDLHWHHALGARLTALAAGAVAVAVRPTATGARWRIFTAVPAIPSPSARPIRCGVSRSRA